MPKKLERCAQKLMAKGKPKKSAYAICNASISEDMSDVEFDRVMLELEELDFAAMTMRQQLDHIRNSFRAWYKETYGSGDDSFYWPYVEDVYIDHPQLGSVIICQLSATYYAAAYEIDAAGAVSFAVRDDWTAVMPTYTLVDDAPAPEPADGDMGMMETFTENQAGHVVEIIEVDKTNGNGPVTLKIIPIQPGPGNKRDGHYYPLEVLQRDLHVFEGAKMYTTDHRADEKNARTEVGTVLKCPDGFTEDGVPYATAGVHDPLFAQSIRNRAELGTLEKLNVSILGGGTAKPGKIGENNYKIVQSITEGRDIDFVTRAGAGGHAVALAESEKTVKGKPKPKPKQDEPLEEVEISEQDGDDQTADEPQPLAEAEVVTILAKSGLPKAAQERLQIGEYADASELRQAILTEKNYLSATLGAGLPIGVGETAAAAAPKLTPAERKAKLAEAQAKVNAEFLGGVRQ